MAGASEKGLITMETRIKNPPVEAVLLKLLAFDGELKREIFTETHVKGTDPKELKARYTADTITGRHYNSILKSVEAVVSSIRELTKLNCETAEAKIKSADKWINDKRNKVKALGVQIRGLTTYRDAKRKAKKAGKRKNIPAKLRGLSLPQLAAERTLLQKKIHHKNRYVISARRRLEKMTDQDTVSVCFGTKELFKKQFNLEANGYGSHEEWLDDFTFARSASTSFVGSSDESLGNQTAQYDPVAKTLSLRLPKTAEFAGFKDNRLVIPDVTFPEKYQKHVLDAQTTTLRPPSKPPEADPAAPPLSPEEQKTFNLKMARAESGRGQKICRAPIQIRIVARKSKHGTAVYIQLTTKPLEVPIVTNRLCGAVGVDINADHLAFTETDRTGNYIRSESLAFNFKDRSSDQSTAWLGDYIAAIVSAAKTAGKPVVIENLDFSAKKATLREETRGYAGMLSSFAYAKFKAMMISRCAAEGVEVITVNPAYSSVIGVYKFYGLEISSHEKAALVLARRALGFSERPKVFRNTRRPPVLVVTEETKQGEAKSKTPSTTPLPGDHPVRMAAEQEAPSGLKKPQTKPRRRARHVWSFWAKNAKTIRQCLVRGCKRKPRVSTSFGETYKKHPLVARAAGVMSLASERRRREDPPSGTQRGGQLLSPPDRDVRTFEQVCTC